MSEVKTFIIDCPWCKAKVAAIEHGRATKTGFHHEIGEPFSKTLIVGECPSCSSLLAGESHQVEFADFDSYEDSWSDVVRIYPKPTRSFVSYRIPRLVKDSIAEADKIPSGQR